ncbi:hypothetical protein Ahy_A05g021937 [Arachis hypogaea]|uniref:RNase H type-1 domain-containing protein n=1 Tax=Arachis hypogaea TaxID=3818 RepID=A0A445CZ05_ARAHY|nr:hypothetical protein Ahy_A05g021937 [Arachis hypogaea]
MASWEDPGRYLGLPVTWGRSKNKALEWLKEKILDKMQGWKEKLLNQAGKEVLIKAVIQAIPTYAMNVIKFPKSFCKSIEATTAKFWWTNNGKERSIHWKSWKNLTKGKLNGGLGFKDVECQNVAHLAKQAWRLLKEEDAIWARTLKAIYYPNCSLWEAGEGRNASWIWKSLLEGRDFLRRRGRWSVGSGTEIDIWKDNWVVGIDNLGRHGEGQTKRVSELIKEGEGWDMNKVKEVFLGNIAELVNRTPISLINKKDHFVWPHSLDGQYLIKSGTAKEQDRILCQLGCLCWCIWKARNQQIFQQTKINPKQVIINAEQLATEYHNTTKGRSIDNISRAERYGERGRITWRPLPQNRLKVNTDAAYHRMTGAAASAVVVRNWQGKIITGTTSRFTTTSAIAAEAQAYREALILQMLDEAPDVGAAWTPREGNRVAHQLAAMAAGNDLRRQWIFNPPDQVRSTIRTEAGFAILQHKYQMQNQSKGVSGHTNQQGQQRNEGLPEREEGFPERADTEVQDMQLAEGGVQLRSTEGHQPTSHTSKNQLDLRRDNQRGNDDGPTHLQANLRRRIIGAENMEYTAGASSRIQHHRRKQWGPRRNAIADIPRRYQRRIQADLG